MAQISGKFGKSPIWSYILTSTCTKRTSTQATIKIELSLGLYIQSSATRFGFKYDWNPVIIGDNTADGGWQWVKDNTPNWSDGKKRNFSWTGTVNLAPNKTNVTVKFNTRSTNVSGANYTPAVSTSLTVPVGNTAPYWTGGDDLHIKLNGKALKNHTIIPENTGNVIVNTPTANDNEQGSLNYLLNRHINDADHGRIKTWEWASKNTRFEHTDSLASYGSGTRIRYYYYCNDGSLSASGTRRSWEYTKNTMQKGSITNIGSIKGPNGSFNFTLNHATNQGGECNNAISYRLDSATNGVVVYGPTTLQSNGGGTTSWRVNIGQNSQYSYFDLNQLRSALQSSGYKGNIKLKVTASNSYGSSAVHEFNVYVDLTQQINSPSVSMSGGTIVNGKYLTERSTFNVSWSAVSDPLGTVNYKLYYNTGGSDQLIANKSSSQLSHSVNLNSIFGNKTVSNLKFIVEAYSTYGGNSSRGQSPTITTYEYEKPSINAYKVLRSGSTAIIEGYVNQGSPVTISKSYWRKSTDAISVENTFTYETGSEPPGRFKITANNIPDTALSIIVSLRDSLNTVVSIECKIAALFPLLTIRPTGVGINGVNEGTGALYINSPDNTTIDLHSFNGRNSSIKFTNDDFVNGKERYVDISSTSESINGSNGKGIKIRDYNMAAGYDRVYLSVAGEIFAEGNKKVYHEGNLPSQKPACGFNWHWSGQGGQPSWVWGGSNGKDMYVYNPSNFSVNYANNSNWANGSTYTQKWNSTGHGTSYLAVGNGDNATYGTHNVVFRSHWGIGFRDHTDICKMVIDTRSGGMTGKGNLHMDGWIRTSNSLWCNNGVYTAADHMKFGIKNNTGASTNVIELWGAGVSEGYLRPTASGTTRLGGDSRRWERLYSVYAVNTSSDRRMKKEIAPMNEKMENLFMELRPTHYKLIDYSDGRRHNGFIAQEIEGLMAKHKIPYEDFAVLEKTEIGTDDLENVPKGILEDKTDKNNTQYSLNYTELIPLNTHMIQKAFKIIDEQNKRIKILEDIIKEKINV